MQLLMNLFFQFGLVFGQVQDEFLFVKSWHNNSAKTLRLLVRLVELDHVRKLLQSIGNITITITILYKYTHNSRLH